MHATEVTIRARFTVREMTNINNIRVWIILINDHPLDMRDYRFDSREAALSFVTTYFGVSPEHVAQYTLA